MTRRKESARSRRQVVLDEHVTLREMIALLRAANTKREVAERLLEFSAALKGHFAGEEAIDGFYASVLLAAPRHAALLGELAEQHAAMLVELEQLIEAVDARTASDLVGVRKRIAALCDRLELHESREHELILEVMNTDIGASD